MPQLTLNQHTILQLFLQREKIASSEVHRSLAAVGREISLVTVKRELASLSSSGLLVMSGAGRSVTYTISTLGRLCVDVNPHEYVTIEPDLRFGLKTFTHDLFQTVPLEVLNDAELQRLDAATVEYNTHTQSLSPALEEKELERFVIELSWKSSRIEGNTYTLLDTEQLLTRGIEAPGHSKHEAIMILNHKAAFSFVRDHLPLFTELDSIHIQEVHKLLVKDLDVTSGFRSKPVGVVGSIYRPLDNVYQITEATHELCAAVARESSPYSKALVALMGISYIQPFEDGNKRTSRLVANALLLAHSRAPLSYRSVEENDYREAMLTFYELNTIQPFKKIFVEQYFFAAKNYAVRGV